MRLLFFHMKTVVPIFVAKHPVTKPRVDLIRKSEILLQEEIDQMMERAFATEEIIEINKRSADVDSHLALMPSDLCN